MAEGFIGSCLDLGSFPVRALSLSAFRRVSFGEIAYQLARALIRADSRSQPIPSGYLRFAQARNQLELLDLIWSGFLSPLIARFLFAC